LRKKAIGMVVTLGMVLTAGVLMTIYPQHAFALRSGNGEQYGGGIIWSQSAHNGNANGGNANGGNGGNANGGNCNGNLNCGKNTS
jgi:hypothetical protein